MDANASPHWGLVFLWQQLFYNCGYGKHHTINMPDALSGAIK